MVEYVVHCATVPVWEKMKVKVKSTVVSQAPLPWLWAGPEESQPFLICLPGWITIVQLIQELVVEAWQLA